MTDKNWLDLIYDIYNRYMETADPLDRGYYLLLMGQTFVEAGYGEE